MLSDEQKRAQYDADLALKEAKQGVIAGISNEMDDMASRIARAKIILKSPRKCSEPSNSAGGSELLTAL